MAVARRSIAWCSARLSRLEAVAGRSRLPERVRRLAIDLAATLRRLVDQDRMQALARQRLGCADAGGTRAEDDDCEITHPWDAYQLSRASRLSPRSRTPV